MFIHIVYVLCLSCIVERDTFFLKLYCLVVYLLMFIVMFPCNSCCHLAGPHPKLKVALSLNSAAPPTGNPRTPKMFWCEGLCVFACVGGWAGMSQDFLA